MEFLTIARIGSFIQFIAALFAVSSLIEDVKLRRLEKQLRLLLSDVANTKWPRKIIARIYESFNKHISTIALIIGSLITIIIIIAALSVEVFTYWNLSQTFNERPQLRSAIIIAIVVYN